MKFSGKQLFISAFCTLAFVLAHSPAIYAVDGCSSVGSNAAPNINLAGTPFGLASADFNADGHLDLAASINNGSTDVVVLLGRGGSERFGPPISYPAGGLTRRLAAGDFNGDGKPDLAVSLDDIGEPNGKMAILLNDGTGKFIAPTIVTFLGDPVRPVIGDVNNDGKLDIVTALFTGSSDAKVAVVLGNGAGGFVQAANSPFSSFSLNPSVVAIADFNKDGKPDLVMPGSSGGLSIWLGDGTGAFAAGTQIPQSAGSLSLTVGDFNNDTQLDVLLDNHMHLGTGAGSFAASFDVPIAGENNSALAGDLNNDNKLDVVAAGPAGVTIMLGNGAGNFVQAKSYTSGFTIFGASSAFGVLGDFNEDGKKDIAGVQPTGVAILEGDGAGNFNDLLSYHTTIPSPSYLVAADFNNDGKQDFVTSSETFLPAGSRIEVALGDGNGGFTKKTVSNFGVAQPKAIATADFNNDGKLDLAVTQWLNGKITTLLNDGTGGFPTDASAAPSISMSTTLAGLKSGDFNNDNKADLIVLWQNASFFSVLLGDGAGGFSIFANTSLEGTSDFFDDLAVTDFNLDGKADFVAVRSGSKMVQVLNGTGFGTFSLGGTFATPGTPASVVTKDLNGDNKPDIAVSNATLDTLIHQPYVTVFINNGAGFNAGTSYPVDGAGSIGAGDFNNDNQADLAVSSSFVSLGSRSGGITILTNKGNGDFNAPTSFSAGPVSGYVAVADFNSDSEDDILISQVLSDSMSLMLSKPITPLPCLSVNDATVTENDAGTVNALFTVTLSAPSAQTVKVNYFAISTSVGSLSSVATKTDFLDVPGTLTFLPGVTMQTISVPVKGDLLDEVDQFFYLTLTTPVNAEISDGRGLGTIVDNDPPPSLTINNAAAVEGSQSGIFSSATFTVSLSGPSEKPISVQYTLEPGTAAPTADYSNTLGTVDFPAGTVSRTINVSIVQDNVFEPDETFFVNLSNPTNATIADGQGQGTITNDDPQPTITIGPSFRTEGAQGTSGDSVFEVKLSNPSYQTITVAYATGNVTATAGADYVAASGTVTFNPGDTTKSLNVVVNGDNTDEVHETYVVNLSSPTNATIATAPGVGTIVDDDGPTISINSVSVTEGNSGITNAVFTISLSAPSVQDVLVNYATTGGTATSGLDFQRVFSNTLVIPAGTTSGTVTVRVFGDFQIEPDEQFVVDLQFPNNATIAVGQGAGTIVNDDSNGKLQFGNPTYVVNEDAGSIVIAVNRLDGATGTVTLDYATSNGTATAGSDYTAASGTLTFNQGETTKSFSIPIVSDSVFEGDETVNLTLSNPTGGAVLGTTKTAALLIKSPTLFLVLEEGGLDPAQVASVESVFFMRDPFTVLRPADLLALALDPNTRITVFVTNLQTAPGDVAATVKVNLVDKNGQSYDVGAEDVRAVPGLNFTQVTFRLPDNLPVGSCSLKIKSHDQESNTGTMRIKN